MEDVATEESSDQFIEITVSEPLKIGAGIGSYIAYKWVWICEEPVHVKEIIRIIRLSECLHVPAFQRLRRNNLVLSVDSAIF